MAEIESASLEQNLVEIQSTENTDVLIEDQFAVLDEEGVKLYTRSITFTPTSPENALWPTAPEGFTGLFPTDKFKTEK